jgi:CheY-like chemotaxis protein
MVNRPGGHQQNFTPATVRPDIHRRCATPRAETAAEIRTERSLTVPPPLRILAIDDESRFRETLADVLEEQGHVVVQAPGGEEGLRLLEAGERFDLVITDLGMPDMTGWDVVRAVRERWPGLPVGLLTGWGEVELSDDERGLVRFVMAKPVESSRLRQILSGIGPSLRDGSSGPP